MPLAGEERGGALVLRAAGPRLDASIAIAFKDAFRAALTPEAHEVVLDLSAVEFLDSSGLGALVAVLKLAGPERRFALAGLTAPVRKVFALTRMDSVFEVRPATAATAPRPGARRAHG